MMQHVSSRAQKKPRQAPLNVTTIRGLFLLRHTTLTHWAREHGYNPSYVQLAIRGQRGGPKAERIVREIKAALDL